MTEFKCQVKIKAIFIYSNVYLMILTRLFQFISLNCVKVFIMAVIKETASLVSLRKFGRYFALENTNPQAENVVNDPSMLGTQQRGSRSAVT